MPDEIICYKILLFLIIISAYSSYIVVIALINNNPSYWPAMGRLLLRVENAIGRVEIIIPPKPPFVKKK